MSTRNSSGLCVIKSKLTPRIGYVVGAVKFFFFFFFNNGNNQYSITTTAPITEYSKKTKKKNMTCFIYIVDL